MDIPSPDLAWTCPTCARRVPRKIDLCRCGFSQFDLPPDTPAAVVDEVQPAPSRRGALFALGIGFIVLMAMFPFWSRLNAPSPSPAPAAAAVLDPMTPVPPSAQTPADVF